MGGGGVVDSCNSLLVATAPRYNPVTMNIGATLVAVLMFATTLILRHSPNQTLQGISITAMLALWAILGWSVRLKGGQAGMEQWQEIRQRGRLYFAFVYGGWWVLFILLSKASLDFAAGETIEDKYLALRLAASIFVVLISYFWDWPRMERKFAEWQRTGPLPVDGVP